MTRQSRGATSGRAAHRSHTQIGPRVNRTTSVGTRTTGKCTTLPEQDIGGTTTAILPGTSGNHFTELQRFRSRHRYRLAPGFCSMEIVTCWARATTPPTQLLARLLRGLLLGRPLLHRRSPSTRFHSYPLRPTIQA